VAGKWTYLYRAVDSSGASIDFLLSAKRDAAAAKRFLQRALRSRTHHRMMSPGQGRHLNGLNAVIGTAHPIRPNLPVLATEPENPYLRL